MKYIVFDTVDAILTHELKDLELEDWPFDEISFNAQRDLKELERLKITGR